MATTSSFSYSSYLGNASESTELSYSTEITYHSTSTTTSPSEGSEDSSWWHLINLIGLAVFLIVVIGPVAYITFCCKRPYRRGQNIKCCVLCDRIFTCYWCRRRLGCTEDVEGTGDDLSLGTIYGDVQYEPPPYDEALGMPRVEDTIPGTPPPMYADYFKVKHEETEPDGGNSYMNPVFEFDEDNIGTFPSRRHSFYSSFGSRITWTRHDDDPGSTHYDADGRSNVTDLDVISTSTLQTNTPRIVHTNHPLNRHNYSLSPVDNVSISSSHNLSAPTEQLSRDERKKFVTVRCRTAGLVRNPSLISRISAYSNIEKLPSYQEALTLLDKMKASTGTDSISRNTS